MNHHNLKLRLLSTLYLFQAAIVLLLLWATSSSFRRFSRTKGRSVGRRPLWMLLRILGKHGANELGYLLPVAMLVAGAAAAALFHSPSAFCAGSLIGFAVLTMIPIAMPMPSSYGDDSELRGGMST